MRRAIRWLTRLLPPAYALTSVAFAYFLFEYFAWQAAGDFKEFLWPPQNSPVNEVYKIRDALLLAAAAAYGMWRVAAFHPFYRQAYAEWLESTPWTSRYPLPRGPIRFAIQDAIAVGVLALAMHSTMLPRQWIAVIFLAANSIAVAWALFWTGPRSIAYTIAFLLGWFAIVSREPNVALALAAVTSLTAHFGVRASLASFPWHLPVWLTRISLALNARLTELSKPVLGFPFDGLSPLPQPPLLRPSDGILLGLLPAWWALAALMGPSGTEISEFVEILCVYLLPACFIGRLLVYLATRSPPISLLGRILTGRWIIPGYDRVLVAPLLAVTAGIGLVAAGFHYRVPLTLVLPAYIATVLLVTLNAGPSLRQWRLTGSYRLVPSRDRRNFIEL